MTSWAVMKLKIRTVSCTKLIKIEEARSQKGWSCCLIRDLAGGKKT